MKKFKMILGCLLFMAVPTVLLASSTQEKSSMLVNAEPNMVVISSDMHIPDDELSSEENGFTKHNEQVVSKNDYIISYGNRKVGDSLAIRENVLTNGTSTVAQGNATGSEGGDLSNIQQTASNGVDVVVCLNAAGNKKGVSNLFSIPENLRNVA